MFSVSSMLPGAAEGGCSTGHPVGSSDGLESLVYFLLQSAIDIRAI